MINRHKYNELCRSCRHIIRQHCYHNDIYLGDFKLTDINVLDYAPCGEPIYDDKYPFKYKNNCGCKEFEPEDNLLYLEMKVNGNE